MKVIWHFYANKVNMGDWASMLGIRQFLSAAISQEIDFVDHLLLHEVTKREVDEINRSADIVVVGGGGLWRRTDLPLGWLWNITPELLCAIRCPIVFYSIGLNKEYHRSTEFVLNQRATSGIVQAVQRAALVGVRDYWTLDWLCNLNVCEPYLVPCPSMLLQVDNRVESVQNDIIGLNTVPLGRIAKRNASFALMEDLLEWVVSEGFKLRYLCHSPHPTDFSLQLQDIFPGDLVAPRNPYELLNSYASVKMVIGMRAHSILFAFNQNRPVFAVRYNQKCEAFMKLLGVEHYSIPWPQYRLWGAGPFTLRKVKTKIHELMNEISEIQHSWQNYRTLYRRYNEEFAAKVASLL